jgi:hypothetical protein
MEMIKIPHTDLEMDGVSLQRRQLLRLLLMAPLLSAFGTTAAEASPINPSETFVLQPGQIQFTPWQGLPSASGEMAMLYGDLNKPGPYLVMMKWNPGWFSAPHNYRTDRICVVVSGTWWVESGADFTPQQTVPVAAGGYVLRHAARPIFHDVAITGTGRQERRRRAGAGSTSPEIVRVSSGEPMLVPVGSRAGVAELFPT